MQKPLTSFFTKSPIQTSVTQRDISKKKRTISELTPDGKTNLNIQTAGQTEEKQQSNKQSDKFAHSNTVPTKNQQIQNSKSTTELDSDSSNSIEPYQYKERKPKKRVIADEDEDEEYEPPSKMEVEEEKDDSFAEDARRTSGGNKKPTTTQGSMFNKSINQNKSPFGGGSSSTGAPVKTQAYGCKAPPAKKSNFEKVTPNPTSVSEESNQKNRKSEISNVQESSENYIDQEDQFLGGGFNSIEEINDALPDFLKEENMMDMNKKKPTDKDYDSTTLYIPSSYKFTPAMQQYWEIKKTNMDKIFLFKLGKFYEIFYQDAIICQKLLDLNWMGGAKKLHVGFPEKALDKYIKIIVDNGLKVAVVEQTETPRMVEERIKLNKNKGPGKQDKVVNREICNVVTKGTFKDSNDHSYEARYVLSFKVEKISQHGQPKKLQRANNQSKLLSHAVVSIGVTFFDISTLKIHVGQFEDDEYLTSFRTLVCQIRPVEVLHDRDQDTKELINMLKNQAAPPVLNPQPPKNCWGTTKTLSNIEKYLGKFEEWPNALSFLKKNQMDMAIMSLGLATAFLEEALIVDHMIKRGDFNLYQPETNKLEFDTMILDGQALQHLEIVETNNGKVEGSLFHLIDHCKTTFGKRQLKRWLLSPLANCQKINDRLDAVTDLMDKQYQCDQFRSRLSKMPDLEKFLAKIFTYSIRHKVKAIYFEDVSLNKQKDFKTILDIFKSIPTLIEPLYNIRNQLKSNRLRALVSFDNEMISNTLSESGQSRGLIPFNLVEQIKHYEEFFVWKKNPETGDETLEPRPGLSTEYDFANDAVTEIKLLLNEELEKIKKKFFRNDKKVQFQHAKYRYEVEVPCEYVEGDKKPKQLEFTSKRQGFERFHTKEIKEIVENLEEAEERLRDCMVPQLCEIFGRFYENKDTWMAALSVLTELDCLSALSICSSQQEGVWTRPVFEEYKGKYENASFIDLKEMRHPCVTLSQNRSFVPNDTEIDTLNNKQSLLLVTGPNMGGKSTLLRQTCIAVILAQIGCYVPARSLHMTPVDRLFTRIGASDRILEGKSTFFVEMEETRNIIEFATFKSLAIVDELGRGTSTFDGYSIAHAVLKYLVGKIKCRTLFSTHYHMLLDEFKDYPGVVSYHMAFKEDPAQDKVVFLYKFIQGECPASFGINVARMANIPNAVLERAKQKAHEFSEKLNILTTKVKFQRQQIK